jgi:bis(5'-nucleosidyl)-tetraphosphatase
MRKLKSCGVIVMRTAPTLSFLLMQHPHRYDLPKGHVEANEDEISCALRELQEETGINNWDIELDTKFRYSETYLTRYKKFGDEKVEKTLVIFLAWLKHEVDLQLSEHISYAWVNWQPPHHIQFLTIDPLLKKLEQYLRH